MIAPDVSTNPSATLAYDASTPVVQSGPFVWHDLMTTDAARAAEFYSALFGWRMEQKEMGGSAGTYTYVRAGDQPFGGIVSLDPRHGIPSHWVAYVAVSDVDATVARSLANGGRTCIPPTEIPNVGRFAMIEDPSGAIVSPISLPDDATPTPSSPPRAGTAWWHELATPDPERAAAFYAAVLGWRVHETTTPEGAAYWLFLRGDPPTPIAGMYRRSADIDVTARPLWLVYVAVADTADSLARAVARGATHAFPATDVPGTGRIAGFVDPTGAAVAIGQPEPM